MLLDEESSDLPFKVEVDGDEAILEGLGLGLVKGKALSDVNTGELMSD